MQGIESMTELSLKIRESLLNKGASQKRVSSHFKKEHPLLFLDYLALGVLSSQGSSTIFCLKHRKDKSQLT